MKFKKCTRDPKELSGPWRLACLEEVKTNIDEIKKEGILDSWDIARLLDGWMSGTGYRYEIENFFRKGVGDMLLVEAQVSRPPDNSFVPELYSGISLSIPGRETALLLSCDDRITEVIYWVLQSIENEAELDILTDRVKKTFLNDRTILHYAADQTHNENLALDVARLLFQKFEYGEILVNDADKHGRTALHFAALNGHRELCNFLISDCKLKADEKDRRGENPLHLAVNRDDGGLVDYLCELPEVLSIIYSHDANGKTSMHKAAAMGSTTMMETLLGWAWIQSKNEYMRKNPPGDLYEINIEVSKAYKAAGKDLRKYITQADKFGQTALQEAASGGHTEAVDFLLKEGSRPIEERNADGKTALHLAVQLADVSKATEVARLLLKKCKSEEEKSLLLWASATGGGTAEESALSPKLRNFLKKEREAAAKTSQNLLQTAVKLNHFNMARELINRGANVEKLNDSSWFNFLNTEEKQRVQTFRKYINTMPERGGDQPTIDDNLGRTSIAEGLAELFLNPCVKTPVTVGILGDWGMGKSSLMFQTESILLQTAAQLAFPNLLKMDKFPGSKEFKLAKDGKRKYQKIRKAVKKLVASPDDENPLVNFLNKYQPKHHEVYRALALMDRSEIIQVNNKTQASNNEGYTLGKSPSILTVRYNAWHYQNELEAWAGLAVETTKVIEKTMTTAQTIRTCCRYAWNENKSKIWLELFLPCLIVSFLASWVALAAWLLLSKSRHKDIADLKFGSIPVTMLIIVWTVMKQLVSVVKPISDQIKGYVTLPDHTGNLGYHQKVINDINFLKEELVEKPSWLWKILAGEWCGNWFGCYPNTVKGTAVPKSTPASKEDLRIIVFVDDLDRCNDAIILQMMSAVNLVLGACEINVILGMDRKMIARAIANRFQANNQVKIHNPVHLADRYMSKIVQIPLALPDPNHDETQSFLCHLLGATFEEDTNPDVREEEAYTSGNDDQEPESFNIDWSGETYATESEDEQEILPAEEAACTNESTVESRNVAEATNDVAVDVEENGTGTSPGCWSKVYACLSCLISGSETLEWEPKLQSTVLTSLMMMQNYSDAERDALSDLGALATSVQKLPREWKRFLTYHRLASNILSEIKEVRESPGWQVQLLVWTFCCCQWRHQLNAIIKNWKKLVLMADCLTEDGPSLRNIVDYYIEKFFLPLHKDRLHEGHDRSVKAEEEWKKLKETLTKYDVMMQCIKYFQKYRLHCKVGDLPWPLSGGHT